MLRSGQYEFGEFQLDLSERALFRQGQLVPLTPKALETLLLLVERRSHIVEKDELMKAIWPDTFVEEVSLARNISVLRKVLSDGEAGRTFIETIPKRGYRFVAPVRQSASPQYSSARQKVMLAVLPFENLSGNPDQEYFSDGLTEEMITQLARLSPDRLGIIARTSAMQFKGTKKRIADIGEELGVRCVLEGSVRRSGNRVRISAQLILVHDETHLWAESYERNLGDVLTLQSDVARAIAKQILVTLTPREEQRLAESRSSFAVDSAVYELYLKGRYFWNKRTEEGLRAAIELLGEAIRLDPAYAPAHSTLAACWTFRSLYGSFPPREAFPLAKVAAERALELDEHLSEAHSVLGLIYAWHDFDWERAENELRRAIEVDANSAVARQWYGFYLGCVLRHQEAFGQISRARRLDPLSPAIHAILGFLLGVAGKFRSAIRVLKRALDLNPKYYLSRVMLGSNYCLLGEFSKAIAESKLACEYSGGQPDILASLGVVYARAGKRAEARKILLELKTTARHVSPYYLARIYAALEDPHQAFECLNEALEEKSIILLPMQNDPYLQPLFADPRYMAILDRMAFPQFR